MACVHTRAVELTGLQNGVGKVHSQKDHPAQAGLTSALLSPHTGVIFLAALKAGVPTTLTFLKGRLPFLPRLLAFGGIHMVARS